MKADSPYPHPSNSPQGTQRITPPVAELTPHGQHEAEQGLFVRRRQVCRAGLSMVGGQGQETPDAEAGGGEWAKHWILPQWPEGERAHTGSHAPEVTHRK